MAIDPVSAGISAGGSLLGGLFGGAAAAKKQKRELAAQQERDALQMQQRGIEQLSQGQQNALNTLVSNFGRALGR